LEERARTCAMLSWGGRKGRKSRTGEAGWCTTFFQHLATESRWMERPLHGNVPASHGERLTGYGSATGREARQRIGKVISFADQKSKGKIRLCRKWRFRTAMGSIPECAAARAPFHQR